MSEDFQFETRFLAPLGILAMTMLAVLTYMIEQVDGVTAVKDGDYSTWSVSLAAGERSSAITVYPRRCLSFYVADMMEGGYKIERKSYKGSGGWREVSVSQIRAVNERFEYRFRASRPMTIVGDTRRQVCGLQLPIYSFDLYGSHAVIDEARRSFKVWRGAPLFARFGYTNGAAPIRCIYNTQPDGVQLTQLKRRRQSGNVLMFYTTRRQPTRIEVWGSVKPCGEERRSVPRQEPPTARLGDQPVRDLRAEPALKLLQPTKAQRFEVQRRLTLAGYDTRGVDGIFGKGTRAAISSWQRARRWPVTGQLTEEQFGRLVRETERAYAKHQRQQTVRQPAAKSLVTGDRPAYDGLVKQDR